MSDSEPFCPFCGQPAMERGKYREHFAPPGWYRCGDCLESTPYHKLPRRTCLNLLKTGSLGIAKSERIERGTARTTGTAAFSLTIPSVQCAAASCLVVGVTLVPPDVLGPPISAVAITRGSQTFTNVRFVTGNLSTSVALRAIPIASGGSASVVISPQGPAHMAAFATEITNPVQSVIDASGGASGTTDPASATTGTTNRATEIAIAVFGTDAFHDTGQWGDSFVAGQQLGLAGIKVDEGYRVLSSTGAMTASFTGFTLTQEWGMAIGTFRWNP